MSRVYPRSDVYRCDGCAEIYDDYDFCPDCYDLCLNCCGGHMPICSQCGLEVERLYDEANELCDDCWAPPCPNCQTNDSTELNAHLTLKCSNCLIDWKADLPVGKWRISQKEMGPPVRYTFEMSPEVKKFMLLRYGAWEGFKKTQESIKKATITKVEPIQEEQIQMQHSHEISKIREETERSLEVIEAMKERRDTLKEARRGRAVEAVKQAVEEGAFTNMKGETVQIPQPYGLAQTIQYVSNHFGTPSLPSGYESEKERLEGVKTWLETLSGEQVELTDDEYDNHVGDRVVTRKQYEAWLENNPLPSDE